MVERDRRVTLFFFQSALFPDGVHPAELVTLAGLPTPAVALQLVDQLAQSLWA